MRAGRNDQLAAILDKFRQALSQRCGKRSGVVKNNQSIVGYRGRIDAAGGLDGKAKRQRVIQLQGALQIEAVAAPAGSALNDQCLGRRFAANREIEFVVGSEVARRHFDDAAVGAFRQIEPGKLDHPGVAGIQADLALLHRLVVNLKINRQAIARRIGKVTELHGKIFEVLLSKNHSVRIDIRDGDVGSRIAAAHVEGLQLNIVAQSETGIALVPTTGLKVRNERNALLSFNL